MKDRTNIGQHGRVPEDKLMAYLQGKLSADEQREIEALLAEEGMDSDAMDGLNELSVNETKQLTVKLNYKLQHDLKTKKYRNKRLFADNKWAWMAVVIVLMLCLLGYCVIRMF